MNDVAKFYKCATDMAFYEEQKKHAKDALEKIYPELISVCPHSEAVEHHFGTGQSFRVCKICGIEDNFAEGSDPGDEYNYGHRGHASKSFWVNADVEVTKDEKYFWTFRKSHGYKVREGKVWHWSDK